MKEIDLIELGFEKIDEFDFYYYLLDIYGLVLVSNDNDNLSKDNKWYIMLLDFEDIVISTKKELKTFLKIIKQDGHVSDKNEY